MSGNRLLDRQVRKCRHRAQVGTQKKAVIGRGGLRVHCWHTEHAGEHCDRSGGLHHRPSFSTPYRISATVCFGALPPMSTMNAAEDTPIPSSSAVVERSAPRATLEPARIVV